MKMRARWAAALLMATMACGSFAQGYPNRPVRIVVPFAPGGGTDLIARDLAEGLRERLGQAVIVENKPGAGTMLATQYVARAPADGYTILLTSASFLISPHVYAKPLYDPIKDFEPITQISTDFHIFAVNPRLVPARTMRDFIAFAKANPKKISFATAGTASSPHIEGEWLKTVTGIDMTHIPYRGSSPAAAALLAGDVQVLVDALATTLPHIKTGSMVALAVPHARRSPLLPDVPTVAESLNLPDFQVDIMNGLLAPVGTPREAIDRIQQEVARVIAQPDIAARFKARGLSAVGSTPSEFGGFLRSENAKWQKLAKDLSIQVE
ncbi:tripartite tricarboxylate transporter substrate binding protein [Hydrogenophaga sp. BPS33]|uniref:tripartite tricarboxylate transporter substrate binding protein n=1 Tax=Hydrogenophaga sp. BPS33 TaxID=2651974 RepID=UPI00131F847E|nr:tripartite tricarboxylate transporter substrate binding protein [Hydrogenophaga sp. BPS33]QHE84776.1 tripartite tricarboxylate transporter substrate binding protein [Hydrogenophaga sp. BPS33]